MMGEDYSLVDIAVFPWVRGVVHFYEASELLGMADFPEVLRALEAFLARPAVQAGLNSPKPV
jgi:GST-like protein